MMTFSKLNTYLGWAVGLVAAVVYTLTVEPTASFWDCGEYIATSYKLEVPHPSGAPLFLLIGKLFSFLSFGDTDQVAFWVNMVSVLASAGAVLFLFWSITLLARQMFNKPVHELPEGQQWAILGAGLVGSLAYTFSDSFWFSAVEAEVYGLSAFFTAIVFWATLRWQLIQRPAAANRWLLFIAYLVGLSVGAHLLNLVVLPILGVIIYFKSAKKRTLPITLLVFAGSSLVVLFIYSGLVPGLPSLAGWFELLFVNGFGLPFGSGALFFAVLFIAALVFGIWWTQKGKKITANLVLLALAFFMVGYTSYAVIVIRSGYDPPIDQNNPEEVMTMIYYLKREQYGSRPLLYGQYYTAKALGYEKGAPIYRKGEEKYEVQSNRQEIEWDPAHTTVLPRMYSRRPDHVRTYRRMAGLRDGEKPSFVDNMEFMFKYQMGHMYWRYFLWNFVGRDGDHQDAGVLTPFEAGRDEPYLLARNEGRNQFFAIPLLLGLLGLIFQVQKDKKGTLVVGLFFFMTGLALVLFLNTVPNEPRERDYIYATSFYAFSIWLGFGVLFLYDLIQKALSGTAGAVAAVALAASAPVLMAAQGWDDHDRSGRYFSTGSAKNWLNSCGPEAIFFSGGDNDTYPLWYSQEVEGVRTDMRVVVLSYFNTDWYIDQLREWRNDSPPLPFTLEKEQYKSGGRNDNLYILPDPRLKGEPINSRAFLDLVKKDSRLIYAAEYETNIVPSDTILIPVDIEAVLASGQVPKGMEDHVVPYMGIRLKGNSLEKKDLMLLDLITNNDWTRPIYLNNTSLGGTGLNLNDFVMQEGAAYRLLPIRRPDRLREMREEMVEPYRGYDIVTEKFTYQNLDDPDVYYNEDYRRIILNTRTWLNNLTNALLDRGEEEKAKEIMELSLEKIPDEAVAYDFATAQMVGQYLDLGMKEKADALAETLGSRALELLEYYDRYNVAPDILSTTQLRVLYSLAFTYEAVQDSETSQRWQMSIAQYQHLGLF